MEDWPKRLPNLETVQKLQQALHDKAKRSSDFRFYSLYDKVYRKDVLWVAYQRCRQNDGAPGFDRQTFAEIEQYGVVRWLDELANELRTKTYQPGPVRRVWLEKPDGKLRPLGIPSIKDRVVQTAAVIVLEPIFEADLQPEQYAYRPQRSALQAVEAVNELLQRGYTEVVDADLSGYFDSIPHSELMTSVARRVSDSALLHLLKMWLVAPVEERDERGHVQRTTRNRDARRGTPQGAPISPLLANLYMRRFVLGWKTLGHADRLQARLVNYADDFVICCRGTADEALSVVHRLMEQLKLTVNETKTRIAKLPQDTFNFLGYTFGRRYSRRTGKAYFGLAPSQQKVQAFVAKLSDRTSRRTLCEEVGQLVTSLNTMLRGWSNYFRVGDVTPAQRLVTRHVRSRLRQWLCRKHKLPGWGTTQFPNEHLHDVLGLLNLRDRPNVSRANS